MKTLENWLELIDETNPPELWGVLLMLADWLEERGDHKADGIRWLAEHERWPGLGVDAKNHEEYYTAKGEWFFSTGGQLTKYSWRLPEHLFWFRLTKHKRRSAAYMEAAACFAEARKKIRGWR